MGKLITIDNGGTLTDICVIEGDATWRTKTVTTPYDLSKCLFEGLRKASSVVLGREDVTALLRDTDCIRYSTTQGTNALVERRGPRLGLLSGGTAAPAAVLGSGERGGLFQALVGDRVAELPGVGAEGFEGSVVAAVNALAEAGASRLVVSVAGPDAADVEARVREVILRTYPLHLLGAVPVLFAAEIAPDPDWARRTWTALVNAFLHPATETFLYHAEHRLREHRIRAPLLVFRNDGGSARVTKTTAIKTYSSGPRAGLEATRALARQYGYVHAIGMDVGGTTTDLGEVRAGEVRTDPRGRVEAVETSFPLCAIRSVGAGGSSIIRVADAGLRVGPESVGSEPGPACFGLGGREATMTDVALLSGLLDASTYFGGGLPLDPVRAAAVVGERVGAPLGLEQDEAVVAAGEAWVARVARGLRESFPVEPETTLVAFGGCGPLAATEIAERVGVRRVVVPRLAAVFSAFGIAFSDVTQEYRALLPEAGAGAAAWEALEERARRDMAAEGALPGEYRVEAAVLCETGEGRVFRPLADAARVPPDAVTGTEGLLQLRAVKPLAHAHLPAAQDAGLSVPAVPGATRRVLGPEGWEELPLYRVEDQPPGAEAEGPAVLEESFWTGRVSKGWRIRFSEAGDVLLTRGLG